MVDETPLPFGDERPALETGASSESDLPDNRRDPFQGDQSYEPFPHQEDGHEGPSQGAVLAPALQSLGGVERTEESLMRDENLSNTDGTASGVPQRVVSLPALPLLGSTVTGGNSVSENEGNKGGGAGCSRESSRSQYTERHIASRIRPHSKQCACHQNASTRHN